MVGPCIVQGTETLATPLSSSSPQLCLWSPELATGCDSDLSGGREKAGGAGQEARARGKERGRLGLGSLKKQRVFSFALPSPAFHFPLHLSPSHTSDLLPLILIHLFSLVFLSTCPSQCPAHSEPLSQPRGERRLGSRRRRADGMMGMASLCHSFSTSSFPLA